MSKLKEISKRYEEIKDLHAREKNYSAELLTSLKCTSVQTKVLNQEKALLDQMNQELNVKFHRQCNSTSPIKQTEDPSHTVQQELNKVQLSLKTKNKEICELDLKLSELTQKYNKLQSEKNQIQSLYIASQSLLSEKNNSIKDLTKEIYELEEQIQLNSPKTYENSQGYHSISNLGTSRSTNKSSPGRIKIPESKAKIL
jgi:chromosome segregation ATPase